MCHPLFLFWTKLPARIRKSEIPDNLVPMRRMGMQPGCAASMISPLRHSISNGLQRRQGWVPMQRMGTRNKNPKQGMLILSGATKRIDGHGLSAFAHPTPTFSLELRVLAGKSFPIAAPVPGL
jgi:hypothetical protein